MSDSKGAYIPFRDLLFYKTSYHLEALFEIQNGEELDRRDEILEHKKARLSRNHYDELLRIHNMQEVK